MCHCWNALRPHRRVYVISWRMIVVGGTTPKLRLVAKQVCDMSAGIPYREGSSVKV